MKLIPFFNLKRSQIYFGLLLFVLFSCGSESKPLNLKNAKPGNLQFFETYSMSEINSSWKEACDWFANHDTLALEGKVNMNELDQRGLNGLVQLSAPNMIGYVYEKDMLKVDSILAMSEIKNLFFKDLKFMWSYGVEEVQNGHKLYALYAVKVPVGGKAIIDGRHIETVETAIADYNNSPVIRISMNDQGSHDWELMTRKNIGRPIAIVIDDHVISCPIVSDAIVGGETEINGNFSQAEADDLAARIYLGRRK